MPKKKNREKEKKKDSIVQASEDYLSLRHEVANLKDHIRKLEQYIERSEENFQDIEIHVNLLTRLLTTLCIEKFGMRVGVLKRMIKRVEKEAVRDSQISHLEMLYKLPHSPQKKIPPHQSSPRNDPWDEVA